MNKNVAPKSKPVTIFFSGWLDIMPENLRMVSLKEEDVYQTAWGEDRIVKPCSHIPREEIDEGLWIIKDFAEAYDNATETSFEDMEIEIQENSNESILE